MDIFLRQVCLLRSPRSSIVLECSGAPGVLGTALIVARASERVVMLAITMAEPALSSSQLVWEERKSYGVCPTSTTRTCRQRLSCSPAAWSRPLQWSRRPTTSKWRSSVQRAVTQDARLRSSSSWTHLTSDQRVSGRPLGRQAHVPWLGQPGRRGCQRPAALAPTGLEPALGHPGSATHTMGRRACPARTHRRSAHRRARRKFEPGGLRRVVSVVRVGRRFSPGRTGAAGGAARSAALSRGAREGAERFLPRNRRGGVLGRPAR